MANKVINATQPFFNYLLGFRYRLEIGEHVEINTLRSDILNSLTKVEEQLRQVASINPKIDMIKYLLLGFADEVILSSDWSHAGDWYQKLLEMEYYKTSVIGEQFFVLLEREGYQNGELAELFYTILALGFRGKYRNNEQQLQALKQRCYSVLPHRLPEDERRLTPGAETVVPGTNKGLPRVFGVGAVATVLLVGALFYFIASQLMWKDIAEVIHQVSNNLMSQ